MTCAYRRDEANMPGSKKRSKRPRRGALFEFNVQPVTLELDENGRVNGVRFCAPSWALRTPGKTPSDADPRQRVCYAGRCGDHGLWLPPAPHARLEAAGVALDSQGRIKAGVESRYRYQTSQEKIFAGGDAVRGADLVVTAMAEGRHAAQGIPDYLARKTTPLH